MKKLLCVVCLLVAVLFVDTANACVSGRCGASFGRSSYSHSYNFRSGRSYGFRNGYGYGFRTRRNYSFRGGHSYGLRAGRGYGRCSFCG